MLIGRFARTKQLADYELKITFRSIIEHNDNPSSPRIIHSASWSVCQVTDSELFCHPDTINIRPVIKQPLILDIPDADSSC